MVSKATIKAYDFESIDEYFGYIVDSKVNGQRTQAQRLYKLMSRAQKKQFRDWFLTYFYYEANDYDTTAEKEYLLLLDYVEE